MEAAAGLDATRATGGLSSRKEWRAVSEHQTVRNGANEELERQKLGHSDERTIYEHGREPLDVDFCSITIDGDSNADLLQQRLQNISRQREELQHIEIELRAQMIARSEIVEMQNSFDAQIKEHASAALKLQEQLHEKEQAIRELERKMDEKDRELIAIKRDNEAAWAKEDLLREQKKELATFRRERDHSEAERVQHIKQIHDLQEHIQDKERQLIDLQEQCRVAQETVIYKDEQLREAQAWISRVQEMDALQSHSLQAELRERIEQCNQLWLGWQRQVAEIERFHLHTVQQLQLEIADLRERNGSFSDESHLPQGKLKEVSQFGHDKGNQPDGKGPSGNTILLSNGNSGVTTTGNTSTQSDHVAAVPLVSSSLLGLPAYLPPGQVTAVHPFVVHQHSVTESVQSDGSQSQIGQYQSISSMASLQQWQNQQGVSGVQMPSQDQFVQSQNEQNLVKSDAKYDYDMPVTGQSLQRDYQEQLSEDVGVHSALSSSAGEAQAVEPLEESSLASSKPEQSLQQISSPFRDSLNLDTYEQAEPKDQTVSTLTSREMEGQGLEADQQIPLMNTSSVNLVGGGEAAATADVVLSEPLASNGQSNMSTAAKITEPSLLDERSLLTCIVRTIPAGGRIRISSTLPNRLGKMLAPLHWHDYKKKYGKLDDFVNSHPEFFVIEGDYIQLREGAQERIVATAALAKVAAAAASSAPYSSTMPSVAVTPMAQAHRLRSLSSFDSKHSNASESNLAAPEESLHLSALHPKHPNGVNYSVTGAVSGVKILSKKDLNGFETRPGHPSTFLANGSNLEKAGMSNAQSKGLTNGRPGSNSFARQPGRR